MPLTHSLLCCGQARAAARRLAGRTDISQLTVPLMQEELRLRRARGEEIARIPSNRPEALSALREARASVAEIPTQTIAPAAAPRADRGAAADGPTAAHSAATAIATQLGINPPPAPAEVWDASVVGRRAMATFTDEDVDEAEQCGIRQRSSCTVHAPPPTIT